MARSVRQQRLIGVVRGPRPAGIAGARRVQDGLRIELRIELRTRTGVVRLPAGQHDLAASGRLHLRGIHDLAQLGQPAFVQLRRIQGRCQQTSLAIIAAVERRDHRVEGVVGAETLAD